MRQLSPVVVVFSVTRIGQRRARLRRAVALTALTALVGSFAWLLVRLPVVLGFALSVGSAIAWCVWIEHHPEPGDLAGRGDARANAQTIMSAPCCGEPGGDKPSISIRTPTGVGCI
jgi:hypothetical protein